MGKEKNYEDTPVLIYFWKEEDSDEDSGWWFAPTIGDDFALAQTTAKSAHGDSLPPESGWHVPHDGDVDEKMRVVCTADGKPIKPPAKDADSEEESSDDSDEKSDDEEKESDDEKSEAEEIKDSD